MLPRLLIVDDDEEIRSQLKWALTDSYELRLAGDRPSALQEFREHQPTVMVLDLGLPPDPDSPQEGLALLSEVLDLAALTKVVVLTGQEERQNALKVVEAGAYDFLSKPVDLGELKIILRRAVHLAQLERECSEMRQQLHEGGFEDMLGTSPNMQQVFSTIRKVATTDASVLILGESGTGKERAAMAIHRHSARKDGPFVAINCSAIPETLLESELFGHEKGSFTGAHAQRKGRIESAIGGTLFLDEIGDLPLAIQVKLLRFLQEHTIERVGGRSPIQVDARVIAATNMDLEQAIGEGRFREDLFYRLAVVVLRLPPLRERPADLLLLARVFLTRFAAEFGRKPPPLDSQATAALQNHSWPGNIRELENRIKRAVIMADGPRIAPADLELDGATAPADAVQTLQHVREEAERSLIESSLRRHAGKMTAVAAELDISRPTLYELIAKLGVERPGK
ncbi:MAG: PEP-CTERM-box response regulator transcription factor [Verrucomicrobiales bacterium]|nr:PEP-CTERM-box response regulator transcription factor [Verrucomicrobiales bacterium]